MDVQLRPWHAAKNAEITCVSDVHKYGLGKASGGGRNRTRILDGVTGSNANQLAKCPQCVAALWLHSPDTDSHDMSRIDAIIKAWPSLPDHIKSAIETLCSHKAE